MACTPYVFLMAVLGAMALGARAQDLESGLAVILADEALAPAVTFIAADPPLAQLLLEAPSVNIIADDSSGPTADNLSSSPTFIELINDQETLTEIAESPELAIVLEANPPEALPLLAEAVLETHATGDAQADLHTLDTNLQTLFGQTAAFFGRKLLRN